MHAKETVYIPVVVAVCLLAVGCSSTSEFVCTSDWLETGSRDARMASQEIGSSDMSGIARHSM